jgi:hypothetical protein
MGCVPIYILHVRLHEQKKGDFAEVEKEYGHMGGVPIYTCQAS